MVFEDEFYTVKFMREGKIPSNWTDLVQCSSHRGATESTDLKDTWFTPYLEEYPIKTPIHKLIITPDNNNKTPMCLLSKTHVQVSPTREGASTSEVYGRPASEGVQNKSN